MLSPRWVVLFSMVVAMSMAVGRAQPAAAKPVPDARFQNWLYKSPDPAVCKRAEAKGNLVFSVDEPPGDFCTLTLFADVPAEADFAAQFDHAVAADQAAKDTV